MIKIGDRVRVDSIHVRGKRFWARVNEIPKSVHGTDYTVTILNWENGEPHIDYGVGIGVSKRRITEGSPCPMESVE